MKPRRKKGSVKDAVIDALARGESCPVMAKRTGIERTTLYKTARRLGLIFPSAVAAKGKMFDRA